MYSIACSNVLLALLFLTFRPSPAMAASLRTAAAPVISEHPQSFSTCLNDPGQPLTVSAEGVEPLTYSWQRKTGTNPWETIEGADGSSYTPATNQAGTSFYRAKITAGDGSAIYSNAATVTIYRSPAFGISAPNQAVCLNSNLTIRSGIDLSVWDISWEKSADSLNWEDMGIHDAEIDHPTADAGITYYRIIAAPKGMPNPICNPVSTPVRVEVAECMALAISKTASADEISSGDRLSYTIELTNRGPSQLQSDQVITLKENLPDGFRVGSVEGAGTLDLEAQTWTGLELAPGESTTLTINGRAAADHAGGTFKNTVTVIPPEELKNTSGSDSIAQTSTLVRRKADLEISKQADRASVKAGQALNYEISITNKGPSRILPSDAFRIAEVLPEGFLARNYAAEEGDFNYLTGSWTDLDLEAGETVKLTVHGFVNSRFEGEEIVNSAELEPPEAVNDPQLPNQASVTTAVSREADLELVKGGSNEMAQNETVSYWVRVSNKGPSYAPGVVITDVVPPEVVVSSWEAVPDRGVTIISGKSGTGNDIEVQADMPAGTGVLIRIQGKVSGTASGIIENRASAAASPGAPDPNPENNTDTHSRELTGIGELALRKTGPPRAVAGRAAIYTVHLVNNTGSILRDIPVKDVFSTPDAIRSARWELAEQLPQGAKVSPPKGTSGPDEPIEFDVTIPPGEEIFIRLRAALDPEFSGELINTATASAGDKTPSDSVKTAVRLPAALKLEKTGPEQAEASEEITYEIKVSNEGTGALGEIVISDRLPLGSVYIESDGGRYNQNYHTVSWTQSEGLAPGASAQHQVTIRTPADASEIRNVASAGNKTDVVVTVLNAQADVSVNQGVPDSVYQDSTFSYRVVARNNGPSTARQMSLTSTIPAGLEIINAGGGSQNGRAITWTIDSLSRNETRGYTVLVKAPLESLIVPFSASIQPATPDPDEANNARTDTTHIVPSANIQVEKTGPAEAYAGEEITYELTVTNLGPSLAENVKVTDFLPSGMSYLSSEIAPQDSVSPVSWIIPRLEAGESTSISAQVKAPGRVGAIRNRVEVSGPFHDEDPDNNQASFVSTITPAADMEVIKAGATAIDSAGIIIYEILLRNNGPSTALNVSYEDQLPPDLDPPQSISHGGIYDAGSHSITWPALPAMAAGTERLLTVRISVIAGASSIVASNTATIASDIFDPDTENNRSVLETGIYPPAEVFLDLSPDRVCKGQTLVLNGGGVRNNVPGTGVYSGPGVKDGEFDPAQLEPGDYQITYTYTTEGGSVKQATDTAHLLPAAFADAGPDMEILEGDSVILEGRATGEVIRWTPSATIADPAAVRAVVAPKTTTTYRLTVENTGTCGAFDEVVVQVHPRLNIPNAFTPNDDGVNDNWKITNIEKYPNATVQVFNRNGDRIFFSRGYAEAWEGDFKGQPIPPGTYYYLVRPNGGILKPATGSVTIIR